MEQKTKPIRRVFAWFGSVRRKEKVRNGPIHLKKLKGGEGGNPYSSKYFLKRLSNPKTQNLPGLGGGGGGGGGGGEKKNTTNETLDSEPVKEKLI